MLSAMALFFSIAAVGMPGLGNFIGEFLSLLGAFQASRSITAISALGLIFAAVYSLWVIQKVFHGPYKIPEGVGRSAIPEDLSTVEIVCYVLMALGLIWMGMYPQSDLSSTTLTNLLNETGQLLFVQGGEL